MSSNSQPTLDSWLSRSAATDSSNSNSTPTGQPSPASTTTRPSGSKTSGNTEQRKKLADIASETKAVLPDILQQLPNLDASKAEVFFLDRLAPLQKADCPRYPKATIKIVNDDSFNSAIALASAAGSSNPATTAATATATSAASPSSPTSRVAVLNMASYASPGGGWLRGALAQEEALCYRSSLALSLHRRFYPWKQRMGLYTPDVVVIRSDMASGHELLVPAAPAAALPVVSVLGIAALRGPETRAVRDVTAGGVRDRAVYARPADRELTKDKMRLCLRMAARRGHGRLVLGALGCGAFRNPREEVAKCWLEVFREAEFRGGWWEQVWFAVYDRSHEGNFEAFEDILGGVRV